MADERGKAETRAPAMRVPDRGTFRVTALAFALIGAIGVALVLRTREYGVVSAFGIALVASASVGAFQLVRAYGRAQRFCVDAAGLIRLLDSLGGSPDSEFVEPYVYGERVERLARALSDVGYGDVAASVEIAFHDADRRMRGLPHRRSP